MESNTLRELDGWRSQRAELRMEWKGPWGGSSHGNPSGGLTLSKEEGDGEPGMQDEEEEVPENPVT
jgi:hypothetical protein